MSLLIKVDIIIAVHNAESTIEETVRSAMNQVIPEHLLQKRFNFREQSTVLKSENKEAEFCMTDIKFDLLVCCYNDASTDKSLDILRRIENELRSLSYSSEATNPSENAAVIATKLITGAATEGTLSRGAGYARNQAVKLRAEYEQSTTGKDEPLHHFLCILDSDDIMHPTRIAEQTSAMLALGYDEDDSNLCRKTLMGCQFDRIPEDSTWHYQNWANSLTDDRLYLEKFRECTLIQPTWFIAKDLFDSLGGYIEAPVEAHNEKRGTKRKHDNGTDAQHYQLIHPSELTQQSKEPGNGEKNSLRLAEDLRFFYAHLLAGGRLSLHRTTHPLVSYRHRSGMSQSSSTPRKLLLKLRAKAWEDLVYYGRVNNGSCHSNTIWSNYGFAIWGAGRDGKDFLKSLSPDVASSVICFVDVDKKKIEKIKWYDNPDLGKRIPIYHFSVLRKASCNQEALPEAEAFGRIDKQKENALSHLQIQNTASLNEPDDAQRICGKDLQCKDVPEVKDLSILPVVVCVAMYRTNGAMESNVASIGRVEGENLWHIC